MTPCNEKPRVVILGAGFGGLAAARALARAGGALGAYQAGVYQALSESHGAAR